jgi:hypothetical protein
MTMSSAGSSSEIWPNFEHARRRCPRYRTCRRWEAVVVEERSRWCHARSRSHYHLRCP